MEAPIMRLVNIDHAGGVIGEEHNLVKCNIIAGVERVEWGTDAVEEPECLRSLIAVEHTAAIGIRVEPIQAGVIFDDIGNTIAI